MMKIFALCIFTTLFSEHIVTGRLGGGLGIQMFLAATVYAWALDIGATPIFPHISLDHVGNSPILSKLKRFEDTMPNLPIIEEVWFQFIHLSNHPQSACLMGFFQSAKYFHHRKAEILKLFEPLPNVKDFLTEKYRSLLNEETVAIHVRRGDYLQFLGDYGKMIMYNLSEDYDYYERALEYFDPNCHFLIFSDDIEFAKKMTVFQNLKQVYYIEGQQHYEDLYLMSMCNHQILSNSTFCWWAAYLCEYPTQKVIFPMKWFGPGLPSYIGPQEEGGYCRANSYTPLDHWIKIE